MDKILGSTEILASDTSFDYTVAVFDVDEPTSPVLIANGALISPTFVYTTALPFKEIVVDNNQFSTLHEKYNVEIRKLELLEEKH